ncbi:1-acyl-sn-glycerol-3-phosphate acyltransferase [Natranaerovirga hydrolytica]|uniref:1-acyl-sn-glycerol-3-phosphate acyltransferase n=1 Tax=Natranaerovirga hydrolytica TaxID=680378 RepID=A0A4V2Q1Q3_9FIRM|nr:lysophospholipid acyltransferase family protein [Natranaerovirga hydrolytica]TCK98481.1 1-acyl-sn-glycerol-3-phosphate acyltransferase [Natranaerovirga hydrolytica]
MIRTIFWFVSFALYQIMSLSFLLKYKVLVKMKKEEEAKKYLFKVTSRWARYMIKTTGSKVNVTGINNIPEDEAVLFVSNHQGNFDIPLLLGYIPRNIGFVAKVELQKVPIVSTWMKLINCVFINRKDTRQSLEAIINGIKYLKKGHSMVLFPEGTRSKGDKVNDFKAGSMKMALKSKVKVIPVTIDGSYKMLEKNGRITKTTVNIVIHQPIETASLTKEEEKELHNNLKTIISR